MRSRPIIAIDGPAGAGKSTVARRLAARLGLRFLDTGALYRAVTVRALRDGLDPANEEALVAVAHSVRIELTGDAEAPRVLLDGQDITEEIRGPAVTKAVSTIAALPRVRAAMVPQQRGFAERAIADQGGVVAEGRDIGTVVFPDADVKVYLDADPSVRAARRAHERADDGASVSQQEVARTQAEIVERDRQDSTRAVAPLRQAADATRLDTSSLSLEEVLAALTRIVQERLAAGDAAGETDA